MYVVADGVKQDPARRWSLPERVFFACGACHILAYAFLKAYPSSGYAPLWIKPAEGFTGNHIVVVRGEMAFDYHGFFSCMTPCPEPSNSCIDSRLRLTDRHESTAATLKLTSAAL
jgi:hypothetical protein